MGFDRTTWRHEWNDKNPDKIRAQYDRDNAARRARRQTETPEEKEARLAKQREKHKRWRDANPDKMKANRNADRAKNRDRIRKTVRAYSIRTTYGITIEEYDRLREEQNHRCKICGTDRAARMHTDYSWRVDHCHTTGKVRGLLCHNCNIAMGLLHENTETLNAMIKYIDHHNQVTHGVT